MPGSYIKGSLRNGNYQRTRSNGKAQRIISIVGLILFFVVLIMIARYFSMPLYKLQHGKQSYSSNEQNSIEYAGSLRPSVIRNEQEQTWKLLTPTEIAEGWEIGTNMMALLRSDSSARSAYYKTMWEIGAYSVDDILALEDLPAVPGGKSRAASLNYVPLEYWAELSVQRAGGKGGTK